MKVPRRPSKRKTAREISNHRNLNPNKQTAKPRVPGAGELTRLLAEARCQWLEANRPAPVFEGRSWLSTAAPQTSMEWELQRLTWHYVDDSWSMYVEPESTWRDYAVEALRERLRPSLHLLSHLAGRSEVKALEELAGIAVLATETLNRLTHLKSPSGEPLLKAFAQKQIAWPILRSFHPHFDTRETDAKKLLTDLTVGEKHPLNVFKGRWNPNDELGRLALKTWRHLESIRSLGIPAGWDRWMKSERDAFKLPEFSGETWIQWFEVGRRYIEETHNTPEKIAKLNTLITAPSKKAHRCSHASRKTIRSNVWTQIRGKFASMAGQNR